MMTHFKEIAPYGLPRIHEVRFSVQGIEYQIVFTQITVDNPYDCNAVLDSGFIKPDPGYHYDVVFDTLINQANGTWFRRVKGPSPGFATAVINKVAGILLDHSDNFNVGFYTYTPEDRRLSSLYCRLITRRKYRGLTLEVGLEPQGSAHLLRTTRFYV